MGKLDKMFHYTLKQGLIWAVNVMVIKIDKKKLGETQMPRKCQGTQNMARKSNSCPDAKKKNLK